MFEGNGIKVARFTYNFAGQGGEVGDIKLSGDALPAGAVTIGGVMDVTAPVTSLDDKATCALKLGDNVLVGETAVTGDVWRKVGLKNVATMLAAPVKITASAAPVLTVGTEALISGKLTLALFYASL